ncbi:hypothetical protein [Flavisolibacter nicotianae]|uniref:hypothetical protein n=1 Tax=Flavisolibacter nicotianae TaxID=2364882 RepID=UPI000EB580C6|nr:hypothetical protein [Flavisolibacter nicotianae]
MYRQIAAILLILAFAAYSFSQAVIVLDYYANTASFAKNCENKARPMLHCNGKCQMMKKLKEQEKKEEQNPERKGGNRNEVVYAKSSFATLAFHQLNLPVSYSLYADTSFPKGIYADIFHPPALV